MDRAVPIIRQKDEGELLWFAGGGVFTMKATSEETAGAFFFIEDRMVRGKVTPLHYHPNEDESMYVLEGDLLIHIDGKEHPLHKGGFFFCPREVPHAFMVTSESAHIVAFQTPGTGEAFYRETTERVSSFDDSSRPADFDRLRRAAENSPSIKLLGPPPFERHVAQTTSA